MKYINQKDLKFKSCNYIIDFPGTCVTYQSHCFDTVRGGFNYDSICYWDALKLIIFLHTVKRIDGLSIRRITKPNKVYGMALKVTWKTYGSDIKPYIYIQFLKKREFVDAYSLKLSSHLSRFSFSSELLDLIQKFDSTGILIKNFDKFLLTEEQIKFDISNRELNFFLKHIIHSSARKARVRINPKTGRRTFYINNCIYFYEKLLNGKEVIRLEMRIKGKANIIKHFGSARFIDLFSQKEHYKLLDRFELVFPQLAQSLTGKSKAHLEVLKGQLEIESQGCGATGSYLALRVLLNKKMGKFKQRVEDKYFKSNLHFINA